MFTSVSSLIQQSNPYEKFVQQLVVLESRELFQLQDRKDTINDQQSSLGTVSSVISSFAKKIEELNSETANSFNPLKATSTDKEAVRIDSISGVEQTSTYDITVHRTASKDIMLSNVLDGSATTLAGFGDGSVDITIGDKTETISITTTKTDENGNTVSKTNEEILASFSDAINNLLGTESDSDVFQIDNDGNVQLSVKSANTGYDERIQFSNASGVLAEVTGNMTHNTDIAKLDAQFTIDGITFERGQNTVDDAITGMTFTLLEASGTQEQLNIVKNQEEARDNIDEFIDSFNNLNITIRQHTFINGQTGNTGPLQGMRSIRNLTFSLRQTALTNMSSATDGELNNLADMGIGFKNNGTMYVEDSELLNKVLTERADEVKALFSDEASPIMAMKQQAENYTQAEGVISAIESGLDRKIDYIDNQIASEQRYLEKYEERQRAEFAELYNLVSQGQRQLNQVMRFQATLFSL